MSFAFLLCRILFTPSSPLCVCVCFFLSLSLSLSPSLPHSLSLCVHACDLMTDGNDATELAEMLTEDNLNNFFYKEGLSRTMILFEPVS